MNRYVVSVGTNIEPLHNCAEAQRRVAARYHALRCSEFIWTEPLGITDQPIFLNGAFYFESPLEPAALKRELTALEDAMGRDRSGPRDGPRTIDLDIVVVNGRVVHRDYARRSFVRAAVDELWPGLAHAEQPPTAEAVDDTR